MSADPLDDELSSMQAQAVEQIKYAFVRGALRLVAYGGLTAVIALILFW